MSDSAYKDLTKLQQVFKRFAWDLGIEAMKSALKTYAPWTNLPILGYVFYGVIDLASNFAFKYVVLFIDLTAIKFVNAELQDAYDAAVLKLGIIADEKGIDSPEFQKERDLAHETFAKFVRYGATRP